MYIIEMCRLENRNDEELRSLIL